MAAPHGPQLGLGPDTGEPIAQHGARVVVTPLLILDVAPAAVEEAAQVPQRGPTEGSSSASPIPARGSGAAGLVALRALPGALERSYWNWRLRSDLAQVDAAFLAFSASQTLLMASRDGGAGHKAVALLLGACLLQLGVMLCAPRAYASARLPLTCAVRVLHSAAGFMSQRGLQAMLAADALQAAGAGAAAATAPRGSVMQAVLACTGIGRLVLQPLGLQLPFRLALPFQLLDFAVARGLGGDALRYVTRLLEVRRHLGTVLHLAHDTLDGLFHVSTALLFPGADDVTPACPPAAAELLVVFVQLLCGCLLPLYCAYISELSSKVRYVQQWASREDLGVRGAEVQQTRSHSQGGAARGSGGAASAGSRGAAAAAAVARDGTGSSICDEDGSISSHSGGSRLESRNGGERGYVTLKLRGPVLLLELESLADGTTIAPHSHAALLLMLVVAGWGLTSQLQLRATLTAPA